MVSFSLKQYKIPNIFSDTESDNIHVCKWINDNIQSGSYLHKLTQSKKVNLMKDRLLCKDAQTSTSVTWNEFLTKIDTIYPNKLLVPYLCCATFDSVCLIFCVTIVKMSQLML